MPNNESNTHGLKKLPADGHLVVYELFIYFFVSSSFLDHLKYFLLKWLIILQGILFFERMTDDVLDSIREQLEVSRIMCTFFIFFYCMSTVFVLF